MTLGFLNQISTHPKATLESLKTIKYYYPDNPVFFSVDGGCENSFDYIKSNGKDLLLNTDWLINTNPLGYPPYEEQQILEWLKRLYIGVLKLNTAHFMMVEDDVILLNDIEYDPDVECLGHDILIGNKIHSFILSEIERISHIKPQTDFYGAGGGSIFKSNTFIDNYDRITKYFDTWWSLYKIHFYPQAGFMDAFMVLYFMLCGKPYTANKRMLNLDPHSENGRMLIQHATIEQITKMYSKDYDIVHGLKIYY